LSAAKQTAEEGLETNSSAASKLLVVLVREIRSSVSGIRIQHSYLSVVSDGCSVEDIFHSFHGTDGMGLRRGKGEQGLTFV